MGHGAVQPSTPLCAAGGRTPLFLFFFFSPPTLPSHPNGAEFRSVLLRGRGVASRSSLPASPALIPPPQVKTLRSGAPSPPWLQPHAVLCTCGCRWGGSAPCSASASTLRSHRISFCCRVFVFRFCFPSSLPMRIKFVSSISVSISLFLGVSSP